MAEKKTKAADTLEDSFIVQMDNETARLLKAIRDSITAGIEESVKKLRVPEAKENGGEVNINKLVRRTDDIEEKLDELIDTVSTVKGEVHMLNDKLDKVIKLLRKEDN